MTHLEKQLKALFIHKARINAKIKRYEAIERREAMQKKKDKKKVKH